MVSKQKLCRILLMLVHMYIDNHCGNHGSIHERMVSARSTVVLNDVLF